MIPSPPKRLKVMLVGLLKYTPASSRSIGSRVPSRITKAFARTVFIASV